MYAGWSDNAQIRIVPPRRIERLSQEPESCILSIKLKGRMI